MDTSRAERPSVVVHTDGACWPNPNGTGGYAAVIVWDVWTLSLHGWEEKATSNRMEMMAAIVALETLPKPCQVTLHSDSNYVVKTMSCGWNRNANLDLWERLDAQASRHAVTWVWVRGHNGDPLNEECDRLAVQARKEKFKEGKKLWTSRSTGTSSPVESRPPETSSQPAG